MNAPVTDPFDDVRHAGDFDLGEPGPGRRGRRSGAHPHARRARSRHRRRGRRGDVRSAILALLAERPMHGYEMIQEIAERSQDLWRPSPGSIYPTLQLLRDENLVTGARGDSGRRLYELTDEGRTVAEQIETPPWQVVAEGVDQGQVRLRAAVDKLFGAVAQAAQVAGPEQQQRVVGIVDGARREVYAILAEAE